MIILTGGAGFIGANMLTSLNKAGIDDILVVDNINTTVKWKNLVGAAFRQYIHKQHLWKWLKRNKSVGIDAIIHLGACTDTMEYDFDYHIQNNTEYTQRLWRTCVKKKVPFIYASSAATYGDGATGFSDDHETISDHRPINPYGYSKHLFDLWALKQKKTPPRWYGIKFFNVYGPFENHKDKMASVAHFIIPQAQKHGKIRLFKSYRSDIKDGDQKRDFVFVQDVVDIMIYLMNQDVKSGIYNAGTGQARSFNDLAGAVFKAMKKPPGIEYFDMPDTLIDKYQYFTQADMTKLVSTGFDYQPKTLEQGIKTYFEWYLANGL